MSYDEFEEYMNEYLMLHIDDLYWELRRYEEQLKSEQTENQPQTLSMFSDDSVEFSLLKRAIPEAIKMRRKEKLDKKAFEEVFGKGNRKRK